MKRLFLTIALMGLTALPCARGTYIQYNLVGVLKGANMNSTADQAIPIRVGKYVVRKIVVTNASANLTLAIGGFYTASSKGGTAVVANTQVFTALSASTKYVDLTLASIVATDIRTESTLYLSLTTAQGTAATADVFIFGDSLE